MNESAETHGSKMTWWWLSYADDDFRGVVLAEADTFLDACAEARRRGLSPGGQVYGHEIHPSILEEEADFRAWFEAAPRWRLLRRDELPDDAKSIKELGARPFS